MAIYEVKDAKPAPASEGIKPRRKDVKPLIKAGSARIVDLLQLSGEGRAADKNRSRHDREALEPVDIEESAQRLIRHINRQLEMLDIQLHLTLFKETNGYFLDIHDCRNGKVCSKIAEEPIDIDDLPDLLQRLRQQAGILLDTKL